MTRPIVTELKRDLEPVTTDPFIDGLANERPTVAPTTVAPETDPQTRRGMVCASPAWIATFDVTTPLDGPVACDAECSLREPVPPGRLRPFVNDTP